MNFLDVKLTLFHSARRKKLGFVKGLPRIDPVFEMSKENISKKLVRSKSGFRIIAVNDNFKSPFLLPEPKWIPDKEVGPRLSYTISKLL